MAETLQPADNPAAPQSAPAATPTLKSTATNGEIPLVRGFNAVRNGIETAENRVTEATTSLGGKIRGLLGFEKRTVEETSIVKTPLIAAGHVIDGTVLNAARRVDEVAEPTVQGLRAIWRASISKILHPIDTIIHPIETAKSLLRVGTSAAVAVKNALISPVRAADELIERTINNTVQQINTKIAKIPAIGSLFARATNWGTGIATKISNSVCETLDWATSPVDKIHEATAPA